MSEKNNTKLVVFIALVIDLISFTVILPLFPSILRQYAQNKQDTFYSIVQSSVHQFRQLVGAPDTPRWNSVLFGGLLGSIFSLMQFLSSPLIGALSDVYGRKTILLLTMAFNAFSYVIWAISDNFTLFAIARILAGISESNASLSIAIMTDVTTKENRGKAMALIGIAFSIGFIIGPIIGAFLTTYKTNSSFIFNPALFCLLLIAIEMVFLIVYLKESLPKEKRRKSITSEASSRLALINPSSLFNFTPVNGFKHRDRDLIKKIGWSYFFYLFIYSGLEFTLGFFTFNRFQYDNMEQGKMFLFIGILMASIQGGYTRRIKPGREMKVASFSVFILIPAFILIAFSYSLIQFYIGLCLYSFASAVVIPCLTTITTKIGQENQKGAILGILRSLGCLARASGPIFACTVFWSFGAVICYVIGSVGMLFLFFFLKKIRKEYFTDEK